MLLDATAISLTDILLRLGSATICGLALGFERERKGKDAGIRTHALVALSSAVITTSALSLYADVQARGGDADPLRVIQGLAQAIGFIAAGTIFVAWGDAERTVRNLTTAASVWLAAAMGFGLAILVLITALKRVGLAREEAED